MKRGAEKQISKDDGYDDEGMEEETPQSGFKKADEDVLSRRKIRALPKRALGGAASTSSLQPEQSSASKFTGFSFSESSSFTSAPNPSAPPPLPTTWTGFPPPAVSTAATNTAKTLSSFLATSSVPPASTSAPSFTSSSNPPLASSLFSAATATTEPSATHATQKDSPPDPAELKFYTSLRGLNESLRASIQKALDDDPFVDVTVFLERYKALRADIQKNYNARPASNVGSATTPTPAPSAKTFSMPQPPSSGFSFPGASSSTSETGTTPSSLGSGFVPSTTVPSDGFTFNKPAEPKSTEPAESKFSTGFSFSAAGAPMSPLPFSFGAKSSEENKKDIDISGSVLFSGFGKPATTTTTTTFSSSPFTFASSSGDSPSTISPFGALATPSLPRSDTSTFTFGSSKPSSTFGFTTNADPPSEGDKDKIKADNTFTFGSPSTATTPASSFSFGTGGGNTPTPANMSSDAKPSRFAGFAGFGKPAASGSTPIGFGFGAAPVSSTTTASGTTSTTTTKSDSGEGTSGEAGDEAPKKSAAESFLLNADNRHDQEGAGEEDEETSHAVKLKAYVLKDDKGTKSWVELGYGVLRIKKHKESGSRRILLRSSSTGQILINFAFHSAFNPALKNKNISFMGHDTQRNSKMYTLKLQTEQQATELKEAFDREIKAKDES